jgi:hypothetical protein
MVESSWQYSRALQKNRVMTVPENSDHNNTMKRIL